MEIDSYFVILCILALASVISFGWALVGMLRKKKGYYYNLMLICILGFMISKCNDVILWKAGVDTYYFSIVDFGTSSSMLFSVFANKHFLAKLKDETLTVPKWKKAVPMIIPAIYIVSYFVLLFSDLGFKVMAISTLYLFTSLPAGYTALKYAIMPDVKQGFISVMRPLNFCLACLSLGLVFVQLTWLAGDTMYDILEPVLGAVFIVVYLLPGILLERGAAKWTI